MSSAKPRPAEPPNAERVMSEVKGLQAEFDTAEAQYEQAKAEAAALKKIMEAKAKKMWDFVRALSAPLPLFEVWRNTPVSELGLPEYIVSILQEAGILTIGQLADWTSSGKRLTDIPHIGEAKVLLIEDAMERYWRDHPRPE